MRKIFATLVGLTGLAAISVTVLRVNADHWLDTAVTYTILGQVPGTQVQLNFVSALTVGLVCIAALTVWSVVRRTDTWSLASAAEADSEDDPLSPFDNDELIMIAADTESLLGGHQTLPIQLQLF